LIIRPAKQLPQKSVPGKEHLSDYTSESRSYLRLCDLPVEERPRERLYQVGERALSTTELLAIVIGSGHGNDNVLQLAQLLLSDLDGLSGLARASTYELRQVKGIGEVKAAQIKAALELGRRATKSPRPERPIIRSPAEAANLLMPEMSNLEQEHTRAILLNTRNYVLSMPTIYIGNLNSTVIRVAELFRAGIRQNAASIIVAHNHPSGDPAPSPEDVAITRKMVEAGDLLGIEVLDHIIIGRNSFVSLKERQFGFD
jgi:DNA repair protein RadC